MKRFVIALDGPASSGKSTIAKLISEHLKIYYLDTGAMYRAVAYLTIKEGLDINNKVALTDFLKTLEMKLIFEEFKQHTFVNGEDVSDKIRTEEVSQKASDVAVKEDIRIKLVEIQREFSYKNGGIIDGRDIGTYVLPEANFKFYLTASVEERARRRYHEYLNKGIQINFDELKEKIIARDAQDMGRVFAPLKKAEDALEIDTTGLSIDEVFNKIIEIIGENNE